MEKIEMSAGVGRSRLVILTVVAKAPVINIFSDGKYKRSGRTREPNIIGII